VIHSGKVHNHVPKLATLPFIGVTGALLGGTIVELPRFEWKTTLSISTILTGAFPYASTTATTSNTLLRWQCACNVINDIVYAMLYAYARVLSEKRIKKQAVL
jgi:hypothetical protein